MTAWGFAKRSGPNPSRYARHRDQIGRTIGITPSNGMVTLARVGLLARGSLRSVRLPRTERGSSGIVEQVARRLQLRGQFRIHTGFPFRRGQASRGTFATEGGKPGAAACQFGEAVARGRSATPSLVWRRSPADRLRADILGRGVRRRVFGRPDHGHVRAGARRGLDDFRIPGRRRPEDAGIVRGCRRHGLRRIRLFGHSLLRSRGRPRDLPGGRRGARACADRYRDNRSTKSNDPHGAPHKLRAPMQVIYAPMMAKPCGRKGDAGAACACNAELQSREDVGNTGARK